ncbi:SI1L3 protein, partial [Illadopsis cleaveri]|nr:SI1L3 protein [Illadopsis cleaveri]
MGVRARVAEWPPRSKIPKNSGKSPIFPSSSSSFPSQFKPLHRLTRRPHQNSKEVEFQEGFLGIPLRQRSSSEVTLSECDPEEIPEIRGNSNNPGLFREYGSTSSIDIQGIPEQSFFEMLNEFRTKKPEFSTSKPEFAAGKSEFPAGKSEFPAGKTEFPAGKSEFPAGKVENRDELPQPKDKPRRRCLKPDDSIFKKLLNPKDPEEPQLQKAGKSWICRKGFAHFDVQSIFFEAVSPGVGGNQRRNTTTGASAASAGSDPVFSSTEDLNSKENLELDLGDDTSNDLLLSCPHFRNEIGGGRGERDVSFVKSNPGFSASPGFFAECGNVGKPTNAGISVLEFPKEQQRNPERLRNYSVEHVDLGARYYRDYFHGKGLGKFFFFSE